MTTVFITENELNKIEVPEGRDYVLIMDREQKGFGVQKTKKGTMNYVLVYRGLDKKQRQEKFARVGQVSAEAARALANARLAQLKAEKGATPRAHRASSPTMDAFFGQTYMPYVRHNNRCPEINASIYNNHIGPYFGRTKMDEVSEEAVLEFHSMLANKKVAYGKNRGTLEKTLSPSTVKRIMIMLRHMFNMAIKDRHSTVTTDPTKGFQLTTERKITGRFLSAKQLNQLIQACKASESPDLADIVTIMAATGLRRDNVLGMEWSWLDEERGTLRVPAGKDKAKRGFTLFLSESVLELLSAKRAASAGSIFVFPNPNTGKPYASCRCAWVTAREKAGLHGLRMHDLRHTYASLMLESGSDIVDVQRALGHTQLKTTTIYLHLTEGRKRERANAAAAATGLFC